MKQRNTGKRFNDDFRKIVVELYHSGQPVKELSCEYGVSEVLIYACIKKFTPVDWEDGSSVTPNDFVKFQKQMHKLQEENGTLQNLWHIRKKVNNTRITDFIQGQQENDELTEEIKVILHESK